MVSSPEPSLPCFQFVLLGGKRSEPKTTRTNGHDLVLAGLAQYIPQSNNFVVFSSYFHNAASVDPTGSIWVSEGRCSCMIRSNVLHAQMDILHAMHSQHVNES